MHIWFADQGEPLPFQEGARLQRYGELTRVVARRGHKVTWWANDFSHVPRGYIGKPNSRVMHDGVEIVLVHGSGYKRNVSPARLKHVALHAKSLASLIVHETPPDIIVCGMPTIQSAELLSQYGKAHGVPVIVDIRDEWPEDYVRWLPSQLRSLGRIALRSQFAALHRACAGATGLCAVTEAQLNYGLRHAGRERRPDDGVFYSGARIIKPPRDQIDVELAAWRKAGLNEGDFVAVFTGSMSPLRPLKATIDAVKRLSEHIPIKLVLAGTGDKEAEYRVRAAGCPYIIFPGWINSVQMTALNEIADVLLAPYTRNHGFSMPTKIFDYMAAGRPLLTSCPGEAEQIVREKGIGIQIREDDMANIESSLLQLYKDPQSRHAMGTKARALFEERFALENILERYTDHIERLAGRRGT